MPTQTGTTGNDYLPGTTGADTLIGLTGNDVYIVDDPADEVVEALFEGTDRIWTSISYTLAAGVSVETLASRDITSTNPLHLTGNEQANTILGNSGNNVLDGGSGGGNTLSGYSGDDTYYVHNGSDVVLETSGNDIVYTDASYALTSFQPIETLAVADAASTTALVLFGNNQSNTIIGNAGNNYIDGAGGTADVLRGLGGDDTYVVSNVNDRIEEAVGGGNDLVQVRQGTYTLTAGSEIETLAMQMNAGTFASVLTGNEFANNVLGNNGTNTLDGGAGADILVGYAGDDTYVVDNSGDAVFEGASGGSDSILTSIDWQLGAGLSVERLATTASLGTTPLSLIGNELVNTIEGNAGNNFLDGGGGNDIAAGGAGNDTYVVDTAADVVNEAVGGGYDSVYVAINYTLSAGQEVEVLAARDVFGTGALTLTGNDLANTIQGNNGDNVIDGKAGSDTLAGFGGADTFAFTTALGANNLDWIFGFSAVDDTISLDHNVFSGLSAGALPAGAFTTGTAAQDADDRIIYDTATGDLYFDADGNASGAAILFAHLESAPTISAADFVVA